MTKSNGKFLIGYDVESGSSGLPDGLSQHDTPKIFLDAMLKIHSEIKSPATIFVTGQTLEQNAEAFRNIRDVDCITKVVENIDELRKPSKRKKKNG